MITHRLATQYDQFEPPAKIYKIIALSFIIITVIILGVIIFISAKKAVITIVAKEDLKNVTLSLKVGGLDGKIAGAVSVQNFYWSGNFKPTGAKTITGAATGEVILYNKTGAVQTLVKTTRLLAANNALFRLSDRVTIPANGQIIAKVYADKIGADEEIGPSDFIIPGLPADKQKAIYAKSIKPMSGGEVRVGQISADDLKNAEASYQELAADAYHNQVSSSLKTGEEILIGVSNVNVTADKKEGAEASDFNISGTSTLIAVKYNTKDLESAVADAVSNQIDAAMEKVLPVDRRSQITVANYDLNKGVAELTIKKDIVVTLDASGDALAPINFVGKKKDEIKRYVLGLDHVYAVDVHFSPSWMMSAPSATNRIKVIVKNVK